MARIKDRKFKDKTFGPMEIRRDSLNHRFASVGSGNIAAMLREAIVDECSICEECGTEGECLKEVGSCRIQRWRSALSAHIGAEFRKAKEMMEKIEQRSSELANLVEALRKVKEEVDGKKEEGGRTEVPERDGDEGSDGGEESARPPEDGTACTGDSQE